MTLPYEFDSQSDGEVTVRKFYDQAAMSPREDTPSVLVLDPRLDYSGDPDSLPRHFHDFYVNVAELVADRDPGAAVFFRLEDYGVHGFLYHETDKDDANGALYVAKEAIEVEWDNAEQATAYLRGELAEWADYANGNVYGYILEDASGRQLDSCWGFIGNDHFEAEVESAVTDAKQAIADESSESSYWAERDVMTVA